MSIITRKIELWIAEDDKEKRIAIRNTLRELNNNIFRAANLIVNNQLYNRFSESRFVSKNNVLIDLDFEIRKSYGKHVKEKDPDLKKILKNELDKLKKQKSETQDVAYKKYGQSKQNVTYQITSRNFSDIPANIVTCLNSQVYSNLFNKNEWNEVMRGERTVRNYKKGMPIPFQFSRANSKPRLYKNEKGVFLDWFYNINFEIRFGRDKSNNKSIVDKIFSNQYTLSDSSIQIVDKKFFLLLCINLPSTKVERDIKLSVGVDLGLAVPAYCALSEGYARLSIGSANDFLRVRKQFQSRKRILQKSLTLTKGGKGRKKKLSALEKYSDSERNFVRTYNHTVAKRIIEFAIKYNAGVVKMEFLEGYGKDENGKSNKGDFVLRNWSYFELQTLIKEKATRENIQVLNIDPFKTSQKCAYCDNIDEKQRINQSDFICLNTLCDKAGEKINADYNAALNIAKSNKIVTTKEECEFYKIKLNSSLTI